MSHGRSLLFACCNAAVALHAALAPAPAAAQSYPERPIRLIVPFPAGGTVDAIARTLARELAEALRQPVVVENRAGGAGSIGSEAVAKATPDGYTLLMGTASTHGTNPAVQKSLPYDPVKDFTPVALVATTPYILVVNPSVPAATTAELLALVRAQPGKLNYGSYGNGSSNHLATELFRSITGADIVHVPYKGGAPAMTDLLAGQVQLMFDVFTTSSPHLRSGKLKLLGVGTVRRSALAPDTPTLAEAGVVGFEASTFFGVFAPAGTPRPIIERLNGEINRALGAADVKERLSAAGADPGGGTPEQLGQLVAAEVAKWTRLVRDRNLRFDP
jgi:tripartite-type tricarboxylate transporter receptor subunit TctC